MTKKPTQFGDGVHAYDCMFHDEGIPDAPCNCAHGQAVPGSYEIIAGEVVDVQDERP